MIKAVLIDHEQESRRSLQCKLQQCCPSIKIQAVCNSLSTGYQIILEHQPDLIFFEPASTCKKDFEILNVLLQSDFESIFIARLSKYALDAFRYGAIGFILKPVREEDIMLTLKYAENRIREKRKNRDHERWLKNYYSGSIPNNVIGIPTLEGFDFVAIHNIIRCEGLQKCTRVITDHHSDIVSSYNLGEFIKLLEPYGFYSPHRSHLINLRKIAKYYKEGSIIMTDSSYVPVSRRKKCEFLERITHL